MFTAALFTVARTWKQTRCPSTDEWIKKLYIYTMEYYSGIKRNAFESVLMKWKKLEPITQSEVSQKEKYKYCVLTHIYGIWRDGTDEFNFRAAMENRPIDKVGGEEGEGEMYGESNIEIYNTMCKTDSQWEFAVWLRELKQGLCNRLKGGMGRETGGMSGRKGTWVYLWLILVEVWQKTTKFCKAIILQLKIFFF